MSLVPVCLYAGRSTLREIENRAYRRYGARWRYFSSWNVTPCVLINTHSLAVDWSLIWITFACYRPFDIINPKYYLVKDIWNPRSTWQGRHLPPCWIFLNKYRASAIGGKHGEIKCLHIKTTLNSLPFSSDNDTLSQLSVGLRSNAVMYTYYSYG